MNNHTIKFKNIFVATSLLCLVVVGYVFYKPASAAPGSKVIGIIQTASHPALDSVRVNFMEELRRLHGPGVDFKIQNGEGNVQQLHAIASQFSQDSSISLLFCVATRAVQAVLAAEATQPVVFSAVTDASWLNLKTSIGGVTGICDMIDLEPYVAFICRHVACETIAIIFNPSDLGSLAMVDSSEIFFKQLGKKVLRCAVTIESEMPLVAASAFQNADAVFCPLDSTVAVTIDMVTQHALQAKKPLMVCDNTLLHEGVFCAGGVSYASLGKQGARAALAILEGECTPRQIPIQNKTVTEIVLYGPTARQFLAELPAGVTVIESVTV